MNALNGEIVHQPNNQTLKIPMSYDVCVVRRKSQEMMTKEMLSKLCKDINRKRQQN